MIGKFVIVLTLLHLGAAIGARAESSHPDQWEAECAGADPDKAINACTILLELIPQLEKYGTSYGTFTGKFHYHRGRAHQNKKQYTLAIADLSAAIRINPKHYKAYVRRGMAYWKKDRIDLAADDLDMAARLDPSNYLPFYLRAMLNHETGRYDRAIADYERALSIGPPSPPMLKKINRRKDEATKALKRAHKEVIR